MPASMPAPPVPAPPPDRYADAVRARRAELAGLRALLARGHRGELRSRLALARITASAGLATELAAFGRELRACIDAADGRSRTALPDAVGGAVPELVASAREHTAGALAAVRVLAAERGLLPDLCWPATPATGPLPALPAPEAPATAARALVDLVGAAGPWRVVLPVAGLPILGAPALGRPAAVPLLLAASVLVVGLGVRARRVALDRARLHRWTVEVLAALRTALGAELDRWFVEVERAAGGDLDTRAAARLAEVDAELAALAPDRAGVGRARG
ncbi:MAG TPA: hypothetical protein VM367_01485 [Pseudonocardia sp.]|nr:hypothetical protein [Pseudonocardia sp.]